MTTPHDGAVIPADPVLDDELIEDNQPPGHPPQHSRPAATWWQRCPHVPAALKSRTNAAHAAKDAAVALLRAPWQFLNASGRGTVLAARAWRRWVTVHDYREAAEQSEKLADKYLEIRELTLLRWRVTGAVAATTTAGVAVADMLYGHVVLWGMAVIGAAVLAITGRRKDGSPGRRPVLAGARSLSWTMDPQILVDAFRDAKLIGKEETLRLVERANRVGEGWAITVDLPATRKATDVIKNREALASALAVDEVQLLVERVRGKGGHAGRVALWVADTDPYARPPMRTPLLDVTCWDVWRPVPFGRDARDRRINLPLVWTSLLVGAIPRQGKTFAARLIAAGLILDAFTRLYIADFKAGKDWDAAAQVAHRFLSGDEPAHVLELAAWLVELITEVQARYRRMRQLDNEICPESKVTPAMSRDPSLDMPITGVFIDEVQVPLEERTPITVHGKIIPAGEYVGELLTWLAKKGPAAGIVLVLATQRPDTKTIPSALRAVLGSRFALRVMDWRDSNIILGEQMNTRGWDSSRLLPCHKGVGILRPDGDTAAGADVLAMMVRTDYMPNTDWTTLCQRGRALRETAGTLTGHAIGATSTAALDPATVADVIGTSQPTAYEAPLPMCDLPEPLASVLEYLGTDLEEGGRQFIPTAELVTALNIDRATLSRHMSDLGCRPTRERIPTQDGALRQVRGYLIADIRTAAQALRDGNLPNTEDD
ncbi:MAG: FtsK/SpoIIIE domain-containing protein [Actinomycetota bacterium]|nr:FtsK/SpoIIIE domain-containing protein [Actinomycetota bacterium]